jgi:MGT family glycosyltransferase
VNVGAPLSAEQWHADTAPWFHDLGARIGVDDLRADSLYRHAVLSFEPAGYNDWSETPTASVYRPAPVGPDDLTHPRIAALDERPTIYATMGTEFYNAEVMASIIAALRNDEWNLIVTTGPQGDPSAIDPGVPNVIVAQWLSQDALLHRVRLIVTHGGAGTVSGALVRGIPAVCIPQGADQFHHAQRVEEMGMGIFLPTDRRAPDDLRGAVDSVLGDPNFRIKGQELVAATAQLPGVDVAADRVEALAHSR